MITEVKVREYIDLAAEVLLRKRLSVAFAESATAGRIAAEFSMACNAGKFLKGGLICYDASLKSSLLDVPETMIERYTPESMEVTVAIARGLVNLIPADIYIGVTGLPCAGGSENAEKPVGTMFVYASRGESRLFGERRTFEGNHQEILLQAVIWVAELLVEHLDSAK